MHGNSRCWQGWCGMGPGSEVMSAGSSVAHSAGGLCGEAM